MSYTEIYLADSNAEIAEYFEELEKANNNEPYDAAVFRKWYSQPVAIYANDGSGDRMWTVLLTDEQYIDRKGNQNKRDKSFKKLDKKFKKLKIDEFEPDVPLHVFGPNGSTQHAPEERETIEE